MQKDEWANQLPKAGQRPQKGLAGKRRPSKLLKCPKPQEKKRTKNKKKGRRSFGK